MEHYGVCMGAGSSKGFEAISERASEPDGCRMSYMSSSGHSHRGHLNIYSSKNIIAEERGCGSAIPAEE